MVTERQCQGTLVINTTKKGAKEYKAKYTNLKGKDVDMAIQPQYRAFNESEAENGDSIIILHDEKNTMCEVQIVGKSKKQLQVPEPKNTVNHGKKQFGYGQSRATNATKTAAQARLEPATSPYNFIPQNRVLWVKNHTADERRYSGTLTCSLEALRPLLVSGADPKKSKEATQNASQDEYTQRHFFMVDGCPTIPGSSLKGLLRSLVETLSCSDLVPINKRKLFWRNIDDKNYYMPKLVDKQKAGFLIRKGADYFIEPVEYTKVRIGSPKNSQKVRVCTGPMPKKKHDYDFEKKSSGKSLLVPDEIIDAFFLQLTPAQKKLTETQYNIKADALQMGERLPVFYITSDHENVDFLGLAKFFRYPTQNTVEDLSKNLYTENGGKLENAMDFGSRLFGFTTKKQSQCGHVSVQAAIFPSQSQITSTKPTVLGQPHETCLAHYLKQDAHKVRTMKENTQRLDIKTMANYNEGGVLRGRKMFWHRDVEMVAPPNENKKVACILHPLEKGVKTTFIIHLHSITLIELGAILEAITLSKGHAHKLGMGKPLGLGSVRLDIADHEIHEDAVHYQDLCGRCEAFFSKNNTHSTLNLDDKALQEAKNAFRLWVLHNFDKIHAVPDDFEKLEHIEALRAMMNYEKRPKNTHTQYMSVDAFKDKRILESVEQLAKRVLP